MGKHVMNSDRTWLRQLFKGCALTLALFILVVGVIGYAYVKYIEARLHKDRGEVAKVISEPIPDEPVNFLLLGGDARGKEKPRTDTVIIAHVDCKKKKAVLISIPRDMRVQIPGKSKARVNAAYAYGGVSSTVKTVENFIDLPIHHYATIDFRGFEKIVDALGGIDIYLEEPLIDRKTKFGIPAGKQKFDGERALNYVRFRRDARGDFGRIERQQKFLKAVMSKALSFGSIIRMPRLIKIFTENAQTDLSASEILKYTRVARAVKKEDVEMVMLPGSSKSIGGASYVIPDEEKIADIIEAVKEGRSVGTVSGEKRAISNRDVKLKILNGCGEAGLATKAQTKLTSKGFKVVSTGNASNFGYKKTTVLYYTNGYQKALRVSKYFSGSKVKFSGKSLGSAIDVILVLGSDYLKEVRKSEEN